MLSNLSVIPILFKKETSPVDVFYECNLTFYLKSDDPRLQTVRLPVQTLWNKQAAPTDNLSKIISLLPAQVAPIQSSNPVIAHTIKRFGIYYNLRQYIDDSTHWKSPALFLLIPNLHDPAPADSMLSNPPEISEFSDVSPDLYLKNFVPGISVFTSKKFCSDIVSESDKKGSWLWLQKKKSKNYSYVNDLVNSNDFVLYRIPPQLVNATELKAVIQHNLSLINN